MLLTSRSSTKEMDKEGANVQMLDEILSFNEQFVEDKQYEQYMTDQYPNKKMVIVTCMDARLTELLPKAMNLRNGDAKIIKNAGAIITQPFGNVMRSVLVALYKLNAEEVFIVGHHECGMTGLQSEHVVDKALERGISPKLIEMLKYSGIDLRRWMRGFDNVRDSMESSVKIVRHHPLAARNRCPWLGHPSDYRQIGCHRQRL